MKPENSSLLIELLERADLLKNNINKIEAIIKSQEERLLTPLIDSFRRKRLEDEQNNLSETRQQIRQLAMK